MPTSALRVAAPLKIKATRAAEASPTTISHRILKAHWLVSFLKGTQTGTSCIFSNPQIQFCPLPPPVSIWCVPSYGSTSLHHSVPGPLFLVHTLPTMHVWRLRPLADSFPVLTSVVSMSQCLRKHFSHSYGLSRTLTVTILRKLPEV